MIPAKALHIVVGGGIGGLAAALSLSQRGFRVLVLERARQFREIGAGIQLGPNVWPMFERLGVAEEIKAQTVFPDQLVTMDAVSGQQITRIPLKDKFLKRFRYPYGLIHRADLHAVLFRKCEASALVQLMTSQRVAGFADNGDSVAVEVEGGGKYECDILIGADGLWSTIRRQLIGDGLPRASGHIAYRSVLPLSEVPEHLRRNSMTLWAGPNNHLVHYPMRGWKLFNVVAIYQSDRYTEGWDTDGDPGELHRSFESVASDVKTMLNKVDAWRMWVLCDRDPLRAWSRGRVTLLGDAAHPMLPYLAQGAAMSIEDAVVLADELQAAGDHNRAFAAYEQKRSARTNRAQLTSRQSGEFFHAAGVARETRNVFMSMRSEEQAHEALAWIYDGI
jgi:3-hydroxybenzoate 6-monooxygenase